MVASGLDLSLLAERYAICRLPAESAVPDWAVGAGTGAEGLRAALWTPDAVTVICAEDRVPPEVVREGGWRALRVAGPLDFELVGILASLTGPLAEAGVPIFALSAYATDYILVPGRKLDRAREALRLAGHRIVGPWTGTGSGSGSATPTEPPESEGSGS